MVRRLIFWLLLIAVLGMFAASINEIRTLAETLSHGKWGWLLGALSIQIVYFWLFTVAFQASFRAVEIRLRVRNLLPVLLGSLIVDAVAPASTAGGVALFVDDITRRGHTGARATAGMILQLTADFSTLTLILLAGLFYLFVHGQVQIYYIVEAAILMLIAASLGGVLLLGLWRPGLLQRIFYWIHGATNRVFAWFKRPALLKDDWGETSFNEYLGASKAIARHPGWFFSIVAIMLGVHLLAILSLQALFAAFYHPIQIDTLIVGYTVGILIAVTSPAPHGTGVVEGSMAVAFVSLNIPWDIAIAVSLAYRGLSFWLPLAVGILMLKRVKSFGLTENPWIPGEAVSTLAALFAGMGVLNLLPVIIPAWNGHLSAYQKLSPLHIQEPVIAILWGVCLLILALGLSRRKRVLWVISLGVMALSVFIHLQNSADRTRAVMGVILLIWLLFLAPRMSVRSDRRLLKQGSFLLSGMMVAILIYSLSGFSPLIIFGVAAGIYFLIACLRPVQLSQAPNQPEWCRAQRIVENFGRSSMAYLTLFNDKTHYISQGGSLIAYTVQGRVAVVLGDPVGPTRDARSAISEFQKYCAQNDWLPAFCLTTPNYLEQYRRTGFDYICLGHEAIIDLADFNLKGRTSSSYRKRYNRMAKKGYRLVFHEPPLSDELLATLRAISDDWLLRESGAEKRFFLGNFEDDYIRNSRIVAVHTPQGHISAFANLAPEYQLNEISVDLVRYEHHMASGTMDFLFVSLFYWAREQGYETFNLGLNALAGVGEKPGDRFIERIMHYIYENGNWLYSFKGLFEFKRKFHPRWEPQYLVYPGLIHLPGVCLAMAQVNTSDKFLLSFLKNGKARRKRVYTDGILFDEELTEPELGS